MRYRPPLPGWGFRPKCSLTYAIGPCLEGEQTCSIT